LRVWERRNLVVKSRELLPILPLHQLRILGRGWRQKASEPGIKATKEYWNVHNCSTGVVVLKNKTYHDIHATQLKSTKERENEVLPFFATSTVSTTSKF